MRVLALALLASVLTTAAAGAAPAPGRGAALLALNEAIQRELKAIELLKRTPPRLETARLHKVEAMIELDAVRRFVSGVPGAQAAESALFNAWSADLQTRIWAPHFWEETKLEDNVRVSIDALERALAFKRQALPDVRSAAAPPAAPTQCSDGKDNDGDGTVDAKSDGGCSSARDVREQSPFSCTLGAARSGGRIAVSGACSGPFAELGVRLLDTELNGRYDVMHAPSCRPPSPTGFRCTAKDGEKNPRHLVDVRLTTTAQDQPQRIELSFRDARRRLLGRFLAISR